MKGGGGTPSLVLGLDLGTSAVKAALFTKDLAYVAAVERPLHTRTGGSRDGLVAEQDLADVVGVVLEALRSLARDARLRPGAVAGAAFCTHRSSCVLLDAALRPRSPLVLWNDTRAAALARALDRRAGAAITRRTGLPVLPFFFGPRAMRLLRETRVRGALAVTADAALVASLGDSGPVTDPSMAARTLLADRRGRFDAALCELHGIAPERLPRVLPAAAPRGRLAATGLPRALRGVPIVGSLADQSAAWAGAAGDERDSDDELRITIGTGLFAARAGVRAAPARGVFPILLPQGDGSLRAGAEANDPSTGATFRTLVELLDLPDDPAALDALARRGAARAEETGRGAIVIPAVNGLGAPWLRPDARGAILGLEPDAGRDALAHALQDGIAARAAELALLLGARPGTRLRAAGGGARSDHLLQCIADRTGLRVDRVPGDAASAGAARGVARLALAATGLRASGRPRRTGTVFIPTWSASRRRAAARGFRELASRVP